MKKTEVENIDLNKINKDFEYEVCPSFSYRKDTSKGKYRCSYIFFCIDELCSSLDYTTNTVKFTNETGYEKEYIPFLCTEDDINNNKCYHNKCTKDDECLSRRCLNSHCAANKEFPVIECRDDNKGFTKRKTYCGKATFESCSENESCYSNKCSDGYCKSIKESNSFLIIFSCIMGVVAIVIIFKSLRKCLKNKL